MKLNTEQELAVFHTGGVLLTAGAGAGKTFVMIQNVLFYIREKLPKDNKLLFIDGLKKIVIMTFTVKATEEMKERLTVAFQNAAAEDSRFSLAMEYFHLIQIGTIHSFCLHLLKNFVAPQIFEGIQLSDSLTIHAKINKLIDRYLETVATSRIQSEKELSLIKKQVITVWDNPLLRMEYLNPEMKLHDTHQALNALRENFVSPFLASYQHLERHFPQSKIVSKLSSLQKRLSEPYALDATSELQALKGARAPTGSNVLVEEITTWEHFVRFKKFHQKHEQHLVFFNGNNKHAIECELRHKQLLQSIVRYVFEGYLADRAISFSDLEFYLAYYLKNDARCLEEMRTLYDYFIVDEFQDTAQIQFQIISQLVADDFSKCFFIGDPKQSIYQFRGADSSVFSYCESIFPRTLSLNANYRSHPDIIEFNNQFYYTLWGESFHHLRQNPGTPREQVVLESAIQLSPVIRIKPHLENNLTTVGEVATVEAVAIFEFLTRNNVLSQTDIKSIAVLYSELTYAGKLALRLHEADIPFKLDLKIDLKDTQAFQLIQLFSRYLFTEIPPEDDEWYFVLQKTFDVKILHECKKYYQIHGFKLACIFLLTTVNIPHSSLVAVDEILNFLDILALENISLLQDVLFHAPILMTHLPSAKINLPFQNKPSPVAIEILSVHKAKGLEWDLVIIGGILSNQKIKSEEVTFGTAPNQFKVHYQGNFFHNLGLIHHLESIPKLHESESLRLLYVATTRAKKHLAFVSPQNELEEGAFKTHKFAWIHHIARYRGDLVTDFPLLIEQGESVLLESHPFRLTQLSQEVGLRSDLPWKQSITMTATGLSYAVICPFIAYLSANAGLAFDQVDAEPMAWTGMSSAGRGTQIHRLLSRYLVADKDCPENYVDVIERERNFFSQFQENQILQDIDISFHQKRYFIRGEADVIVVGENKQEPSGTALNFSVWDFKTGVVKDHQEKYFTQLKIYAFGFSQQFSGIKESANVLLGIRALDEAVSYQMICTLKDVRQEISQLLDSLTNFVGKGCDYCPDCGFRNICEFSQMS